ncbi:hypothetical protein BJX63DRAFT_156584 [Aspergillus granulosus]|uniref:Uncharacterized protein n=1 Tax=Aspergillus granulosus TaxID=176169 RepID=A0ABR4HJP9_9EURO
MRNKAEGLAYNAYFLSLFLHDAFMLLLLFFSQSYPLYRGFRGTGFPLESCFFFWPHPALCALCMGLCIFTCMTLVGVGRQKS